MASTLSPGEEAQLAQTIEMFEVITQSQPQDYQSLEILKEAYSKLGREKDVIGTSKRIAAGLRPDGPAFLGHPRIRNHPPALPGRPGCAGRAQANREQGQQLSGGPMPAETAGAAQAATAAASAASKSAGKGCASRDRRWPAQ